MSPAIYELKMLLCEPDGLKRLEAFVEWERRWVQTWSGYSVVDEEAARAAKFDLSDMMRRDAMRKMAHALHTTPGVALTRRRNDLGGVAETVVIQILRAEPVGAAGTGDKSDG